jgi:hypothetical protein
VSLYINSSYFPDHIINLLVFVKQAQGVFCEVEIEALRMIKSSYASKGRAMAHVVSHRPPTTEAWLRSYINAIL